MGGASGQQSQSQGSSSGTSNFFSSPTNLQYPQYSGLAGPVGNAITGALQGSSTSGFAGGNGQLFQPSAVYNPALGYNVPSNNTAFNPLVAGVTPEQQQQLNNVNTPNIGSAAATNAGLTLNQNAYGTPTTGFTNAAGNIVNQAPGNFAPGANLAGTAGAAGANVFNNAAEPWRAANTQALYGDFGAGTANAGAGAAQGGNFGVGQAANAANYANTNSFGIPQANTAAGFAGQGQQLSPVQAALQREMSPDFAYNTAVNPFTQGVVQAAVNPLIQSFNAQTVPGLQGTFTAAGQRVNAGAGGGVGGSSAFDIAGANALTGLGANIGSTAASILNPTYQTGLGIQANAPVQAAGVQGQILQGLESSAAQQQASNTAQSQAMQGAAQTQASTQAQQISSLSQAAQAQLQTQTGKTTAELQSAALAGTLTAQESAALTAASQASTGAAAAQAGAQTSAINAGVASSNSTIQQLATAATTNQGIASQQLNDTINALNANALPQLTQQYGINQGLLLFNTQVNQLLTAMGLGGQVSQPAIGNIASGGGSSQGQNTSSGGGKGFTLF